MRRITPVTPMEPLDLKRLETEELPDLDPRFSSSQRKSIVFPVMNESATKETKLLGDTIEETVNEQSVSNFIEDKA